MKSTSASSRLCVSLIVTVLLPFHTVFSEHWSGFRGSGNSVSAYEDLPVSWSDEEGIAWRIDLAGYGQSSPVIWDETVYVTSTAGENKETLIVEAVDRRSGEVRWKKERAASQKAEKVSDKISGGAPTPVVDALGVYAFFESGNLVALHHDGTVRWERSLTEEFGDFVGGHGVGSSLVNTPDGLVLLIDHDGPSYLLLIDRETGKNKWKADREPRVSWTTPLYLEHEGVGQLVVSSNGEFASYGLADGKKLWWVEGVERNTVASPTSDGEIVVIGSSDPGNSLAVALGGEGNVTESHLKWRAESVTSSFGSPLIYRDSVYFVNRAGALQSTSLFDGSLQWERRIPSSTWASPLAANGRLYFFCKDGQTVIFDCEGIDAKSKPLSENVISVEEGDRVYGFALAPRQIVLRTGQQLVCVGH